MTAIDRMTNLLGNMEVTWQVKPSDWVLLGDQLGRASALFTVDSKLTGRAQNFVEFDVFDVWEIG